MRTTVEITDEQHRALSSLAQRRGLRGFSQLVQEALEAYLRDHGDDEISQLLNLEGTLSEEEEAELRGRMGATRATWRTS
jgi:metal-responsive CopG/Arc/MetJ family transcriptional regulator